MDEEEVSKINNHHTIREAIKYPQINTVAILSIEAYGNYKSVRYN
ncbi:MAG: hypothetical protein ACJA1H_002253 [Glaciecola sp.]